MLEIGTGLGQNESPGRMYVQKGWNETNANVGIYLDFNIKSRSILQKENLEKYNIIRNIFNVRTMLHFSIFFIHNCILILYHFTTPS